MSVISHGHFTYISHTFHMAPSSSESYLLLYVYSWYTKFDFTAGRIPPFYWEPCDWCGLMSVDIPATNHSKCLETAKLLLQCQKSRPPSLCGHVTFSDPSFGLSVMTDSPFCHLKNLMIPQKTQLRPPPRSRRKIMTSLQCIIRQKWL